MRKLLFFFVVVCLAACSSIDCPVQNIVSVQYEVCDKAGKAFALTDSLSVVTTRVDGENIDITKLLNSNDVTLNRLIGKSSFSLPISYSHPEDVLFFCFTDTVKTVVDTVWIKKDDIPHFESVDCNAAFFHEITDVRYSRHYIDSLVLLNKTVNYDQTTVHFRLVPKSSD
ncbi:MAG: hypothetical protein J5658_13550 [Prevotella sp.]|nr:hypothetical protein [Prevotella sp.]